MTDAHLISQLGAQGYQARIVPLQHLHELQEEIERHYRQGLLDEQFYQENLNSFAFSPLKDLPQARSIIVVTVPQPQFQLVFNWREKVVTACVPPTYLFWREAQKRLQDALAGALSPFGLRAVQARLPQKLLAVRSGLGQYGKNNVCYVPGLGSFHRLWTFYSDLVCQQDPWQEAQMMERCQKCSACLRNCPSGAITSERFLLHAERCITLHNEQPGDVPFPAWMEPGWHNALVGCMRCQEVCPENKELSRVERGAEFSEQETALLLEGVPLDQLPTAMVEKMERLDLGDYVEFLPRNLGALLGQQS
jgi:epoxyqueuosine reductase